MTNRRRGAVLERALAPLLRRIGATVALGLSLCATSAMAAATYEVNLKAELNGLDVKVATVENPGGLIVRLTNASAGKVKCALRFDAQPQPLARKTVYVEPGETVDAPFMAKRKWFEVDVEVACTPAK